MNCPNCGQDVDGAFCKYCGIKLGASLMPEAAPVQEMDAHPRKITPVPVPKAPSAKLASRKLSKRFWHVLEIVFSVITLICGSISVYGILLWSYCIVLISKIGGDRSVIFLFFPLIVITAIISGALFLIGAILLTRPRRASGVFKPSEAQASGQPDAPSGLTDQETHCSQRKPS